MASYEIETGDFALHEKTLTPSTADTVTVDNLVPEASVLIHPSATLGAVYVTGDGSTPGPSNAKCRVVFPGSGIDIRVATDTIKVYSTAAFIYSVEL